MPSPYLGTIAPAAPASVSRHLRVAALRFSVATWNIHYCIGTDRRFAPDRVARVVNELDADLVGLQEVGWHWRGRRDFDQFDYLARETGYRVVPGPVRHHDRAHFGNALLSRLPVRSFRTIELTQPFRAPRGALDCEIELGDGALRLLVAHLGLDPWERRQQIQRLMTHMAAGTAQRTLLVGDFNEWRPVSAPLALLEQRLPNVLTPRTFHARRPVLRLDRMYASADLAFADWEVPGSARTRRASDHLPILATLEAVEAAAPQGHRLASRHSRAGA